MIMLNELFGPSIHLLILDLFLENPGDLMNLREVARRIEKNPGSISRVIPLLVENGVLEQVRVGENRHVYRLNSDNKIVEVLKDFFIKLKELGLSNK